MYIYNIERKYLKKYIDFLSNISLARMHKTRIKYKNIQNI